jgi:molybdate transport system ATP-binding protein
MNAPVTMPAQTPAADAAAIRVAFRGTLGAFSLDAAFQAPGRGVTALFGPSGCGKTTVLRCIAGLTRLDGVCDVAGEVWQDEARFRPTHRREIGYVFQEASLFAHLSVRKNLLYGTSRDGRPAGPAGISLDEAIDLLGLDGLLDRAPHNLSGGERQRVALGRALLSQPKLLLMDEPLSALDRLTKDEILPFLERLHERLSLPIFYVSHDMAEVERLADFLVLMGAGKVLAAGPLAELQSDPSLPLARTRDAAVSLAATVESYDVQYGLLTLSIDGARLLVPASPAAAGEKRRIRIAAGDVSLALTPPEQSSILNIPPARIVSLSSAGPHEVIAVLSLGADGGGARLLSRLTRRSAERLGLKEGAPVFAQVKGVSLAMK